MEQDRNVCTLIVIEIDRVAGIYLHIPFCERKCFYCDFYSITDSGYIDLFLAALRSEIGRSAHILPGEEIETIFFGGGTPSLLTPSQIASILGDISGVYRMGTDVETTIEVNPGTIDKNKIKGYIDAGINRLSIGVQSFNDDDLRFLQRIHSSADALRAMQDARECGTRNLSIDLMYALPQQSPRQWMRTLEETIALQPEHISAYSLIVEDGTPLATHVATGQIIPVGEDKEASLYRLTMDLLGGAGYRHYEVSNYARPGFECRHNSNYWNHQNYIGFGPSAHSFVNGRRSWNIREIRNYISLLSDNHTPVEGEETLTARQRFEETVMLGLRTGKLECTRIDKEHGTQICQRAALLIDSLVNEHLATENSGTLSLTPEGFLLCDEITERILAVI